MNKIVFFSVVFPSVEQYLDDFFTSLQNQTVKEFDVFIINDGLPDFSVYKRRFGKLPITDVSFQGTPAKIREFGINYVSRKRYDFIVFGDADDYFAENRIEVSASLLKDFDIVVNDLDLVDENKRNLEKGYLSRRIGNRDIIRYDYVRDKNIFGMSNTAIKGSLISNITIEEDLVAIDWCIFAQLLADGVRAVFTNDTTTYYRQHERNIVGIKTLSKDAVLKGIMVKVAHYKRMAGIDFRYSPLYERSKKLKDLLTSNAQFLDLYLKGITDLQIKNPFWWEEIKLVEV